MRIAIFSDIHGNTPGLRAVLAAIERAGGVDLVVAAGDLLGGGPGTEEIIDLLVEHEVKMLAGNWEEILLQPEQVILCKVRAHNQDFAWRSSEWLRARLGQPYLDRLAALPEALTLEAAPGHRLTVCHAAPGDTWSNTCAPGNDMALLRSVYGGAEGEVVAYGHYHAHHTLWLDGKLLVNVASVGERSDGLSACTFLQYAGFWQVQQIQVPYDTVEEARLTAACKPPGYG